MEITNVRFNINEMSKELNITTGSLKDVIVDLNNLTSDRGLAYEVDDLEIEINEMVWDSYQFEREILEGITNFIDKNVLEVFRVRDITISNFCVSVVGNQCVFKIAGE